jgi:hypothetical protein
MVRLTVAAWRGLPLKLVSRALLWDNVPAPLTCWPLSVLDFGVKIMNLPCVIFCLLKFSCGEQIWDV